MDPFTVFMGKVNAYIQNPFGMFTVCTAPIIGYFVFKTYIRPRFEKKDDFEKE